MKQVIVLILTYLGPIFSFIPIFQYSCNSIMIIVNFSHLSVILFSIDFCVKFLLFFIFVVLFLIVIDYITVVGRLDLEKVINVTINAIM